MAQRILKNNTASPVVINDTGYTVPASGQLVIPPQQYGLFEGSDDVITFIGDKAVSPDPSPISTLTVNDGTFDLAINEGTRLIQGGFSRPISSGDDPTIKAKVASDGTDNRLFVDAKLSSAAPSIISAFDNRLKYEDMNTSTGGIARDTVVSATFTDVYSYSGDGYFLGFIVNVEDVTQNDPNKGWWLRFIIDGVDIAGGTAGFFVDDIYEADVYDLSFSGNSLHYWAGWSFSDHDAIRWEAPFGFPVVFNSSVVIQIRRADGSKKFRAGGVALVKGL